VRELGAGAEKFEGLLQFLDRRQAAVEVVVDGEDGRRAGHIKLPLLLLGGVEGVERRAIRSPGLLSREEDGQTDTEDFRAFPFKPSVDSHWPTIALNGFCFVN
jgi:hypothetical protein